MNDDDEGDALDRVGLGHQREMIDATLSVSTRTATFFPLLEAVGNVRLFPSRRSGTDEGGSQGQASTPGRGAVAGFGHGA